MRPFVQVRKINFSTLIDMLWNLQWTNVNIIHYLWLYNTSYTPWSASPLLAWQSRPEHDRGECPEPRVTRGCCSSGPEEESVSTILDAIKYSTLSMWHVIWVKSVNYLIFWFCYPHTLYGTGIVPWMLIISRKVPSLNMNLSGLGTKPANIYLWGPGHT